LLRTIASSPMLEAVLESNRTRAGELTNEARLALSVESRQNPVATSRKSESQPSQGR
jgi:hypothetical protein